MKCKVEKGASGVAVLLGDLAAQALLCSEADVFVLREGVLLVCAPGALEKTAVQLPASDSRAEGPSIPSPRSFSPLSLNDAEQALLHKLSLVEFKNRLVPSLDASLSAGEKKALQSLLSKKIIYVYKDEKYPKGVYNIPRGVYSAAKANGSFKPSQPSPSNPASTSSQIIKPYAPFSNQASGSNSTHSFSKPGSLNTVEHLVSRGYMVLNNENEAKTVMPDISLRLKDETVKGIRGFDRKYYVLRRSFLMEYESRLLPLLDAGEASVRELGEKLGLDDDAATVLLMILGDEGEVIETKKGKWRRA